MINKTGREKNISSWLNHSSILTCQATGNPRPEIIWSKGGQELFRGSTTGNITIKPQKESDFGIYTCLSRNVVESDLFEVYVTRTGKNGFFYKKKYVVECSCFKGRKGL